MVGGLFQVHLDANVTRQGTAQAIPLFGRDMNVLLSKWVEQLLLLN